MGRTACSRGPSRQRQHQPARRPDFSARGSRLPLAPADYRGRIYQQLLYPPRMVLGVVVPFLNEERVLTELLESIARQERLPDQLVLLDDGSSDGSYELARQFAARHPYVIVARRPQQAAQRDRLASASELLAFQWAVHEHGREWDIVAKVDADLLLPPCTFREMERHLDADERLGIAGSYLTEERPDGTSARIRIGDGHVHGATKFYRRACWDEISPLPAILGWDTIDELRARMRGWRTQSFALPGGDPLHLRPRGTYDGLLRGFRRWGECAWAFGEPPVLVALQAVRHMRQAPAIRGGWHYAMGWGTAALRRSARAEADLRTYVRRQQWRRVRARLRGRRL